MTTTLAQQGMSTTGIVILFAATGLAKLRLTTHSDGSYRASDRVQRVVVRVVAGAEREVRQVAFRWVTTYRGSGGTGTGGTTFAAARLPMDAPHVLSMPDRFWRDREGQGEDLELGDTSFDKQFRVEVHDGATHEQAVRIVGPALRRLLVETLPKHGVEFTGDMILVTGKAGDSSSTADPDDYLTIWRHLDEMLATLTPEAWAALGGEG